MANLPATYRQIPQDSDVWVSLRDAIATSSGFQRWQQEQVAQSLGDDIDQQVRAYLRDTLETLAY